MICSAQIKAGNVKELNLIIKADVQGSVEAVKQSLIKLSNEEVVVKVIHGGVGTINESDVSLAAASNAIIIGFNVRVDSMAKSIGRPRACGCTFVSRYLSGNRRCGGSHEGYARSDLRGAAFWVMLWFVRPSRHPQSERLQVPIVLDGKFVRGCSCRITRDGEQLYDGPLVSLKRFKDDVKEVAGRIRVWSCI